MRTLGKLENYEDLHHADRMGIPDWMRKLINLNPEVNWKAERDPNERCLPDANYQSLKELLAAWVGETGLMNFHFCAYREATTCPACDFPVFKEMPDCKLHGINAVEGVSKGLTYPDSLDLQDLYYMQNSQYEGLEGIHTLQEFHAWMKNRRFYWGKVEFDVITNHLIRGGHHPLCQSCDGSGLVNSEPTCHCELDLWLLRTQKMVIVKHTIMDFKEWESNLALEILRNAATKLNAIFEKVSVKKETK